MLKFEWDEFKNKQNRSKHGIWFEEAQTCFDDKYGRLFLDQGKHSEDRFLLLGYSSSNSLLIVVHCYLEDEATIRIISARKATKRERSQYEERI